MINTKFMTLLSKLESVATPADKETINSIRGQYAKMAIMEGTFAKTGKEIMQNLAKNAQSSKSKGSTPDKDNINETDNDKQEINNTTDEQQQQQSSTKPEQNARNIVDTFINDITPIIMDNYYLGKEIYNDLQKKIPSVVKQARSAEISRKNNAIDQDITNQENGAKISNANLVMKAKKAFAAAKSQFTDTDVKPADVDEKAALKWYQSQAKKFGQPAPQKQKEKVGLLTKAKAGAKKLMNHIITEAVKNGNYALAESIMHMDEREFCAMCESSGVDMRKYLA